MSLTPWLPIVRKIKDGEAVDQSTVNVPIDQLAQREQHLYDKFEELSGKSVLISFGQPIHPDETFNTGELLLTYFKSDQAGAGLARGVTGFSSSASSSMFTPKDSNYIFGLVKAVYTKTKTADLYTEGLCELEVDLDDSNLGLIQKDAQGNVETFAAGPYFLSSKVPGKITRDPSGIPVYVGYALTKRKFLLHTNVDEFSQFFINYRYNVLDRVAGVPVLDNENWTITSPDRNKLGWINAEDASVISPDGATFYYNIPGLSALTDSSSQNYDAALTDSERLEAAELNKYLPPVPANFIQLYINGTLASYNNTFDSNGVYSVNPYGLWWHTNVDGTQPWASSYPLDKTPADWAEIKATVTGDRKKLFASFSKFNPALRTQLVSSLSPHDTLTNRPSNFIKFYSKENPSEVAVAGDLLFDVDPVISNKGVTDNTDLTYPENISSAYTANRALAGIVYSKSEGVFKAAVTPVVAKLIQGTGVTLSEQSPNSGIWLVSASQGLVGQVDSIEPINSRLEFLGLTSYIKLPPPSTTPYGLIGKIILPKGYVNNRSLRLVFHVFGDTPLLNTAINRTVALQFQYSVVSALADVSSTSYNLVNNITYAPEVNPVEFTLVQGNAYSAYSSLRITHADLTIPAGFVGEDSVINFKILRTATGTTNTSYLGNIGLIATYWEII
jgi:hypothetical protein